MRALRAKAGWIGAAALILGFASCAAQLSTPRVVEDRVTGTRWILEGNQDHPGGPAKMTELAGDTKPAIERSKMLPVILAGDRVTVVEKTAAADVNMEGIATSPAAAGQKLKVRLAVEGWMVQAVVLGPGRARIAEEMDR